MKKQTNSKERIEAAIALEKIDKVPVAPMLDYFAATYAGISYAEFMNNGDKRIAAVLKTNLELGPWDMTFMAEASNPILLKLGLPLQLKIPGKDLPAEQPHQFVETEFLKSEDYKLLEKKGLFLFLYDAAGRRYPELMGLKGLSKIISCFRELKTHKKLIEDFGIEVTYGFAMVPLFEYFSLGRGLEAISIDIFDKKEKIKSAGKKWAKSFTSLAINAAKFVGVPRIFIGLSRSSPQFISPKDFEELVLPDLEYIVNTIIDAGINPILHCDTNWIKSLHYFRRFPSKKCILQLDGFTNIYHAKEILGDKMAIMGDVPSTLFAYGTRDKVLDYSKKLIEKLGRGFILSSGCSIPANAKNENVKALREAVELFSYGNN